MSSPDSSRHDTFRLGSRTKAIMATHRPMASAAAVGRERRRSRHTHGSGTGLGAQDRAAINEWIKHWHTSHIHTRQTDRQTFNASVCCAAVISGGCNTNGDLQGQRNSKFSSDGTHRKVETLAGWVTDDSIEVNFPLIRSESPDALFVVLRHLEQPVNHKCDRPTRRFLFALWLM